MKVTRLTSKDLLIDIYGIEAVQHYESVKTGSMQLGHQLAKMLIRAVGGRPGNNGDPFDGVTQLGAWEFCLQRNTKNAAGDRHDLDRAPGRCVQILGEPRPGWISAEDFLVRHGKPPTLLLDILEDFRGRYQIHQQMRIQV